MKDHLLERDGQQCQRCGRKMDAAEAGIDHMIPLRLGGASHSGNLQLMCVSCNSQKGGRPTNVQLRLPEEIDDLPRDGDTAGCLYCGYAWASRVALPKSCIRCGHYGQVYSLAWDKPKVVKHE